MFNFDPTKVIKDENSILKGGFGIIYPYKSKKDQTGGSWVVKVQKVDFEGLRRAMQEIALGFKFEHPNILSIAGFDMKKVDSLVQTSNGKEIRTTYEVYIKMPRMKQNLEDKWKEQKGERFSESQILKYFSGIVCGLIEFHRKKIAHKDIKPQNILLDKDGTIKIADIGLAKCLEIDVESMSLVDIGGGTLNYLAPEIREADDLKIKKDLHLKSDLWSLGITILELCLLEQKIINHNWSFEKKEKTLAEHIEKVKALYSDQLASLLRNLLQRDPNKRIELQELAKKLEELLGQKDKVMEEEVGENRVIKSEMKRKPGEVSAEDIESREGSILTVRDQMRASPQGLHFTFEANETDRALVLKPQKKDSITDKNLEDLFIGLVNETEKQNYTKLAHLKLDLKECQQITGSGIKGLATQAGSHLKNITQLYFDFSYCSKMSDSGVTELAAQIGSNLQNITQLHLNFFWCIKITDSGFKELATNIGLNLKNIAQLYLNFAYCDEITDSGFKILASQIGSNLENLTQLELHFSACHKITDVGFGDLVTQIRLRKNITLLRLYFSGCSKITYSVLKELADQLGSNLKSLSQLHLDFSYCEKITGEEVKELKDQIKSNFKNITHLQLDF